MSFFTLLTPPTFICSKKCYLQAHAIILAAGFSSRMQKPKALLPLPENTHTFIEGIFDLYRIASCSLIHVVTTPSVAAKICTLLPETTANIVLNQEPERERMYSVFLGASAVPKNTPAFIHNCDNAFIQAETLKKMYTALANNDVVVPRFNSKNGHPVLLSANVLEYIRNLKHIPASLTLKDVLAPFSKIFLPVEDAHVLTNINTPQQYKQLIA